MDIMDNILDLALARCTDLRAGPNRLADAKSNACWEIALRATKKLNAVGANIGFLCPLILDLDIIALTHVIKAVSFISGLDWYVVMNFRKNAYVLCTTTIEE